MQGRTFNRGLRAGRSAAAGVAAAALIALAAGPVLSAGRSPGDAAAAPAAPVRVGLGETVTLRLDPAGHPVALSRRADDAGAGPDPGRLVLRFYSGGPARQRLFEAANGLETPVRLHLSRVSRDPGRITVEAAGDSVAGRRTVVSKVQPDYARSLLVSVSAAALRGSPGCL